MTNTLASWLVFMGTFWLAVTGLGQAESKVTSPLEADARFRALVAAPAKGTALTEFMDVWLDGQGFEGLRKFLKRATTNPEITASELRATALAWSRLGQDDEALADLRRASEMREPNAALWLERAHLEARMQLFNEAIVSLDQIGTNADSKTVGDATELRWSIARHRGGDTQALAKVRLLADARTYDTAVRLRLARWEAERGNRDRLLLFLRERIGEEKDAVLREEWRMVLLDALLYHGQAEEAVRVAIDGVLEAKAGSTAEEKFIAYLVATFQQSRFETELPLSPADVAKALANRPTAVLAMVDVMRLRGEEAEAVKAVASLPGARPDDGALVITWADSLADAERFDEAVAVLKSWIVKNPHDAAAIGRMAVILREAGRDSEGAKALQDWAVTPNPDETRIRKVAALLPLFLPRAQAKAWSDAAMKNLTKRQQIEIRKGTLAESVPPEIQQIEESGDDEVKRIGQLLELRKRLPQSDALALALVKAFIASGREPEAWQVMISRHERCVSAEETRKFWSGVLSLEQSMGAFGSLSILPRLQEIRRDLNESANYWIAMAEIATLSGDVNTRIVAYTEAVRLGPTDAELRLGLADSLADSGATVDARRTVAPLLNGPSGARARLFLAGLDLNSGRIESAERMLVEVMDDPASDARDMETMAVRLMGWRRWTMAASLLAAQRVVHPKDYRLACLHGIALKEGGDRDSAAEVFFELSAFRDEIDDEPARRLLLRRHMGEAQSFGGKSDDPMSAWREIVQAVQMGLNYQNAMSEMVSERRSRSVEQTVFLAPLLVRECGARAMAHLMDLARDMTEAEKMALVQRARVAGLPLPEALLIGRLERRNNEMMLVLDDDAVRTKISEPGLAQLWVANRQMTRAMGQSDDTKRKNDAKVAQMCVSTLLQVSAIAALDAALLWWRSEPASEEAVSAVIHCIGKCEGAQAMLMPNLSQTLLELPPEIRRNLAIVERLGRALIAWRDRIKANDSGMTARADQVLAACFFAMAKWEDAAASLDEAATFRTTSPPGQANPYQDESNGYRRGNTMPAWIYLQASSPLVWPLMNAGADKIYISGMLPPSAGLGGLDNKDAKNERAAFLAAGKGIKDRQLRLSWLIAARDEESLVSEVRAWAAAEPASGEAALLAACVAAHEKDDERALHLLHDVIGVQKDEASRRAAQLLYLRSVFFAPGQSPFNSDGRVVPRAPVKGHQKRVTKILRDLHPLLVRYKLQIGDGWPALFLASGLEKEGEELRVNREQRQRSPGPWLQATRDFFENSNRLRGGRRSEERIAPYHIERLAKGSKRDRVIQLCLTGLRREADERYLAEMQRGENIEEWRRVIAAQGLSSDLMKAADPGVRRSFRRLVQAMHVAVECNQWGQAIVFGDEALKLMPRSRSLEITLILARLHGGGDPSNLVEALKRLPQDEARSRLWALLASVRASRDTQLRMKMAAAIVKLAGESPETIRSDREGGGQILSETFRMLAESVVTQETETLTLLSELTIRVGEKQKTNPETPEQLAQRKQLIASLGDSSLKNPAWGDESLRYLTASHLIEKKPTADELASYIREVVKRRPENGAYVFDNWVQSATEYNQAANRIRIARLALNLIPDIGEGDRSAGFDSGNRRFPEGLVRLIGNQVASAGIIPLYALWEYPDDITTGEQIYSEEQLALNKERKELFASLWKLAQTRASWMPRLFPFWAGYRLHFDDGKVEVLDGIRKLKDTPGDPFTLRSVVQMVAQSYSVKSHVALAEITNTLLLEEKWLIDQPEVPSLVEKVMKLVANGRAGATRPPSISVSPADAAKMENGIEAELQKRRQAVHGNLRRLLGDRIPATPESLFSQLEIELRTGKDTAKLEKVLMQFAKSNPSSLSEALVQFIERAQGQWKPGKNEGGYEGGVWEPGLRVKWFEAALRIGRPLVEKGAAERAQSEWLKIWIVTLMQPNTLAVPAIPPIAGMEGGYGYAEASTEKLYASMPVLKKRDALYAEALELAMTRTELQGDFFYHFAVTQMAQNPPDQKVVFDVAISILRKNPESFSSCIRSWLSHESGRSSLPRLLACGEIIRKYVEEWPMDADVSAGEWLQNARATLFQGNSGRHKALPLLANIDWNISAHDLDVKLATPGARQRHAAWVRIVDAAALKSNLAPHVFADFARLHLVEAPDRVIACANLIVKTEPEKLRWAFDSIYRDESAAPLDRRLEWGRLALRLMPMVKGKGAVMGDSPAWLAATLTFLQSKRPDYADMPKENPPTEESIRMREDLVAKLAEEMMSSPGLAIESLVPYARKQFQMGEASDGVLDLVKKSMSSDAPRVNDQLQAWCDALLKDEAKAKERLWAAQVLVPLAEAWPAGTNGPSGYWMQRAGYLIGPGEMVPEEESRELSVMLERLMDASLKKGTVGPSMIADYAATKTGKAKVQVRVGAKALQDPVVAGEWMRGWWSSYRMRMVDYRIASGIAAEGILRAWPRESPAETLTWTYDVLSKLALPVIADPLGFHREVDQVEKGAIPAAPGDASSREVAQKIVGELIRRKVRFDWLTPTRLRFALAIKETDAGRRTALESIFKNNPERDEAASYLRLALEPEKPSNGMSRQFARRSPRDFSPDAKVAETLDAVRCVRLVAEEKWLPAEVIAPLLELSRERLRRIISRPRINPNAHFVLENELPPEQGDAAMELLKMLVGSTTLSHEKKVSVQPETLPTRLDEGLRAGEPVNQLADEAWALVKSDPVKTADALRSWAGRLQQSYRRKAFTASGEVALNLAERWTGEQPAPDWLVAFVSRWSNSGWLAEPGEKSTSQEEVLEHQKVAAHSLPKLIAILKKFPSCQDLSYFRVVSPLPGKPMEGDATEEELVELALAHIKAQKRGHILQGGRSISVVPMLGANRGWSGPLMPLFIPHDSLDAHLFLVEYAWLNKKEKWLRETCRPAIESGRWLSKIESFDRLTELYFCSTKEFVKNAAEFARDGSKGGTPVSEFVIWSLRVAKLRAINLDAVAWAHITNLATRVVGGSSDYSTSQWVVAWLLFRQEMHSKHLDTDLRDVLGAVMGRDLTERSAIAALDEAFIQRRNTNTYFFTGSVAFGDRRWGWFWETLKLVVTQPDCFGAALHVADEVGLLAEGWCGGELLSKGRASSAALSEVFWRRTLEATQLTDTASMPSRAWLMPVGGLVPIWELARNCSLSAQPGAEQWLKDEMLVKPTIGKALLWLGAKRDSRDDIAVEHIEAALAPCRAILKNQPRERLAQLTAALLVVQPRLIDAVGDSGAGSILKLLPPPAVERDLENVTRRWLAMTPAKLPVSKGSNDYFRPFAYDLCRLIRAQAPQVDAVFDAGVRALAGLDWSGRSPPGIPVGEWVIEQVGVALLTMEGELRRSGFSSDRGVVMGPDDDNRRNIPLLMMRFMLGRGDAFTTALMSPNFDRMIDDVWATRMRNLAWDGGAIARDFMSLPGPHLGSAQLVQINGMRKALASLPFTSLEQMVEEAVKAAAVNPSQKTASWILRYLLESELLLRTGKPEGQGKMSSALLKETDALWRSEDFTPAARLSLAQSAPGSIPSAKASTVLGDWTRCVAMRRPSGNQGLAATWYLTGDLRWLSGINESVAMRQSLIEAADVFREWQGRPSGVTYYEASTLGGSIADRIVLPLARALESAGEIELRWKLLKFAAEAKWLPFEILLSEMRRDAERTSQELASAFFIQREDSPYRWVPLSAEPFPGLTRDDEVAIEKLHEGMKGSSFQRTAYLVLSAFPDSTEAPPKVARHARVTAIVEEILRDSQFDHTGVDVVIARRGVPETLLAELLPLLRVHPRVKQWVESGMKSLPVEPRRSGNMERTLILWALAEVLHGGRQDAWSKLMAAIKQKADDARPTLQKGVSFSGGIAFSSINQGYIGQIEAIWQGEASLVLSKVAEWWVSNRPPADWPRLVQPFIENSAIGLSNAPVAAAHDLSALLQHEVPDFSTRELDAAFASDGEVYGRVGDSLWRQIAATTLSGAQRWQILSGRCSKEMQFPFVKNPQLLMASRTGFLTAGDFAALVDEAPLETLHRQPVALVDWLVADGKRGEARNLLVRVVSKPPAKVNEFQWLLLAAYAHDLGDDDLARRFIDVADQRFSPRRHLIHALEARLGAKQ